MGPHDYCHHYQGEGNTHILFRDGVYDYHDNRPPRFQRVKAPAKSELEDLVQQITQRVGRCLERRDCWNEMQKATDWTSIRPKTPMPCPRFWAAPSPTASPSARSKGAKPS
ncbi:MAG: transposase [Gammaproteobacteria bacterium]|nr:transposase [Gammaproteobacteria bacterium]